MLTSLIYASTIAHVMEREFLKASVWMLLASMFAFVGLIHAFQFSETGGVENIFGFPVHSNVGGALGNGLNFTIGYLSTATLLYLLHLRDLTADGEIRWKVHLRDIQRIFQPTRMGSIRQPGEWHFGLTEALSRCFPFQPIRTWLRFIDGSVSPNQERNERLDNDFNSDLSDKPRVLVNERSPLLTQFQNRSVN